jgi:hypothetical protein
MQEKQTPIEELPLTYLYKGLTIEIHKSETPQGAAYKSLVRAPGKTIASEEFSSQEEAEFAAEELIDSWN